MNRGDQAALFGVAGHNCRLARGSTLEHALGRIKSEPGHRLFGLGAMTRIAVVRKDRSNLLFEKLDAFLTGAIRRRGSGRLPKGEEHRDYDACESSGFED